MFAFALAVRKVHESRDPEARSTDVAGLVTFSAGLFLLVFGLLRGNDAGWGSAQILGALLGGLALLAGFLVVEVRQERPMLDVSLFRQPAFVGVQLATFCLGAGMFALFPFLSIYLQDIDGNSPLGAGLRFLPITAFVFLVPLVTRKYAARAPLWLLLGGSLAIVAVGLALMESVSVGADWTVLLAGFIVSGIGIGLANPTIAGAALRVVDPSRTGMASGISNTCRVGGLAVGVAALGVLLQHRIGTHLAAAGYHGKAVSAAVTSSGYAPRDGDPRLAHAANVGFVSGLRLIFLVGCFAVLVGAGASLLVRPRRAERPEPVTATTSRAPRSGPRGRQPPYPEVMARRVVIVALLLGGVGFGVVWPAWARDHAQTGACKPRVVTGVLPVWARGGFSDPKPRMPHALSAGGKLAAILWVDPLLSPRAKNHSNKILWVARGATDPGSDLRIRAQRMNGATLVGSPVARKVMGGPGPSIINLPAPGCWRFTLRWSGQIDTLDFAYAANR